MEKVEKIQNLETLQFRVFVLMTKYLTFKELMELSLVSKPLRKQVAKTLFPLLKPHFSIKSYIEKYPYKALRGALSKKLWILDTQDFDFLLAKNKHEKEGGEKVKKNLNKKKRKKLFSVLPGTCITELNCTQKLIAFGDHKNNLHVMDIGLLGKYSKYKSFNMKITIPNVVKREFGYSLIWQNKQGELFYLKDWQPVLIKVLKKGELWSSGFTRLILITDRIFKYYPDFHAMEEPEHECELEFDVEEITVAKNYYYLISKEGNIYQGEIGKFKLLQINSTAKKPKLREIFKEKVVSQKIIYPNGYQGKVQDEEEEDDDDDMELLGEKNSKQDKYEKVKKPLKIYSNAVNSFICLSDSKMKKINSFTRFELAEFFKEIGLGTYAKLILFQKVTGEKLLQFNEMDLEDNLGIQAVDEQNHLMLNVNHRRNNSWEEPELNVWGYNGGLEFGIRTGVKTISVPHKLDIKLNDFQDYIEDIKMGNGGTVIKSKKKKFFMPWEIEQKFDEDGNLVQEEEELSDEVIEEDDQLGNKFKNKKKKKKKKKGGKKGKKKPPVVANKPKRGKRFEKDKWRSLNEVVGGVHAGYEIEDVMTMKKQVREKRFIMYRLCSF